MNNYPDGVSGHEYQIAGPDWDRDANDYCSYCDKDMDGTLLGYGHDAWFVCDECGEATDKYDDSWA